ncbi:MAG: HAMP domain-containing histidine kinase [Myxococcaceae bacterium]|nr:MAG: HAMP domain-containing histidine kinase [Myxococcaceae bacterium]
MGSQGVLRATALGSLLALALALVAARQTVASAEEQFVAQQRLLVRGQALVLRAAIEHAEVAAAQLNLSAMPAEPSAADAWLAAQLGAFRVEAWVHGHVEGPDGAILARAGAPAVTHRHHGVGAIMCRLCLDEREALVLRGAPDDRGRVAEVLLTLHGLDHRVLGPLREHGAAVWLEDARGRRLIGEAVAANTTTRWLRTDTVVNPGGEALMLHTRIAPERATDRVRSALWLELSGAALSLVLALSTTILWLREQRARWAAERAMLESTLASERDAMHRDRLISLGVLSAGMAHEIMSPLTALRLGFELMSRGVGADELGPDFSMDALQSIDQIRDLVCDLRLFARADLSARAPVQLRAVLTAAVRMTGADLRSKARLELDITNDPWVEGSSGQLLQVFVNLLVNAMQAITEGRPADNLVLVRARSRGREVVIEVSDTGAGIPPDVVGRIFEPFFTTKAEGVGTGLGLSVCHGIARAHGGSIVARANDPHGTVFTVTLPMGDCPSAARSDE